MKRVLALTAALLLSACAATPDESAPKPQTATAEQAEQAISAAEAAQKKAASVKYEWRDTGKLITEAKEAAKKGEFDLAVKKAKRAQKEGELAYKQHEENAKAK